MALLLGGLIPLLLVVMLVWQMVDEMIKLSGAAVGTDAEAAAHTWPWCNSSGGVYGAGDSDGTLSCRWQ